MSKFLTGKELEDAIINIIWRAEKTLLLVSPYIKLDDYFKQLLDKHENNPEIHMIVVFGKNEKDVSKSLSKADFDYFKKFLKVSIIYVSNLHAKYYGNEKRGVITSINLYDFSFKNNIEFGVFFEQNILDRFTSKSAADLEAWNKCCEVAYSNPVVFIKRPVYENKKGLFSSSKNFIKSQILQESTEDYYGSNKNVNSKHKLLDDFPEEIALGSKLSEIPLREKANDAKEIDLGYCIRSGEKIKFNPKQPMSKVSWRIWNEYGNEDFPEKYCHKTGKLSNGMTSMRKPIL